MSPFAATMLGGAAAIGVATLTGGALARAGFPLPPAARRIGCIDGLRGYLALLVLVHHFAIWVLVTRYGRLWAAPDRPVLNELGRGAVALFFMTTGLVFYPRVLAGLRATAWPAVAATRVFRILPLVAVSVLLVLAIIALRTGGRAGATLPRALLAWLTAWDEPPLLGDADSGRLNAYVLWSLWYEWIFYAAILPACALARDLTRGRLPSWSVPVALVIAARLAAHVHPLPILPYLPAFAIGMLAYEAQLRPALARRLRSRRAGALALAVLGMAAWHYPETFVPRALTAFGFFFVCVACGNDLFGALRTRGALVLGECSFGIYLLHGLVLDVFFVDLAPAIAGIGTGRLPWLLPELALLVLGIAAATYLAVERPMIRRGARVAKRWTGRRVRMPAQELEVAP